MGILLFQLFVLCLGESCECLKQDFLMNSMWDFLTTWKWNRKWIFVEQFCLLSLYLCLSPPLSLSNPPDRGTHAVYIFPPLIPLSCFTGLVGAIGYFSYYCILPHLNIAVQCSLLHFTLSLALNNNVCIPKNQKVHAQKRVLQSLSHTCTHTPIPILSPSD